MSGHSKWSQIKHQKGAADVRRGQLFTKLGNAITLAVRENGIADPNSNFKLRMAIEKGRSANMPKINIDRAIERGLGKGEGIQLEEIIYEGFGPGRIAVLIQVGTDNRQRTNSKLKNIFSEYGGTLSSPGAVLYLFKNYGIIKIKKENYSEEKYTEFALESGSIDLKIEDDYLIFYTDVHNLHKIKEYLDNKNLPILETEIIWKPSSYITIEDKKTIQQIVDFLSRLESEEDVQKVATNFKK